MNSPLLVRRGAALLFAWTTLAGCRPATGPGATLELSTVLGGPAEAGFARALEVRAFTFPADHGAHPDLRSEWWYYTGNLATAAGRPFGYQLTFFRTSLAAPSTVPPRDSAWGVPEVWMAHLAVSDPEGRRFAACERFARRALDLAGATADPFAVWLGSWQARASVPVDSAAGGDLVPGMAAVRLAAHASGGGGSCQPLAAAADEAGTFGIDLVLQPRKPITLQGDRGLSRKGDEPGNASYYYSLTRLAATGTITAAGERHAVTGTSWLDREWSTSALSADEVGWDWFALQLADGRELMLYQLRRRDGTISPHSSGTLVAADGLPGGGLPITGPVQATTAVASEASAPSATAPVLALAETQHLGAQDFRIEVLDRWTSPRGGTYPARWRLLVPAEGLDLEVTPRLGDQELNVSLRYWEGAVTVDGSVGGVGYVELTGYAATR